MRAYIALGSNVGDRAAHLRAGVEGIARAAGEIRALSSVWETEPVEGAGPGLFLNMAAAVETERAPEEILAGLLAIESSRGRTRGGRVAPRTLDLDLLLLGDLRRDTKALVLPHPRLETRRFVLAPLAEIAPDLTLPASGRTVAAALSALPDRHAVRRVGRLYTPEGTPVYSPAP